MHEGSSYLHILMSVNLCFQSFATRLPPPSIHFRLTTWLQPSTAMIDSWSTHVVVRVDVAFYPSGCPSLLVTSMTYQSDCGATADCWSQVDDLIATGGTLKAGARLVGKSGLKLSLYFDAVDDRGSMVGGGGMRGGDAGSDTHVCHQEWAQTATQTYCFHVPLIHTWGYIYPHQKARLQQKHKLVQKLQVYTHVNRLLTGN